MCLSVIQLAFKYDNHFISLRAERMVKPVMDMLVMTTACEGGREISIWQGFNDCDGLNVGRRETSAVKCRKNRYLLI